MQVFLTENLDDRGLQPEVLLRMTETLSSSFIPIKALVNVGRAAVGESPHLLELSAEIEVLDPTGRVVMSGMSTRQGDHTLAQGGKITWADLTPILNAWAKRFRQSVYEARGVGDRPESLK